MSFSYGLSLNSWFLFCLGNCCYSCAPFSDIATLQLTVFCLGHCCYSCRAFFRRTATKQPNLDQLRCRSGTKVRSFPMNSFLSCINYIFPVYWIFILYSNRKGRSAPQANSSVKHELSITHFYSCLFLTFPLNFIYTKKNLVVHQGLFVTYLYIYVYNNIRIIIISFQVTISAFLARVWEWRGIGTDCPVTLFLCKNL